MSEQQTERDLALIEVRAALRAGQRNPPVARMAPDPREAVAFAMAVIRADEDKITKADALGQLAARVDVLVGGDTDEALRELAATMPLLESMFVRYAMQANQTDNVEYKAKLTKLALQCHASFARSLALIGGLKAQRKGDARVLLNVDRSG